MKRTMTMVLSMVLAAPAFAGWPGDAAKCKVDAVKAGSVCMDKYEASVWEVPNATTTNKKLVAKIQNGVVTAAQLAAGGAVQRGVAGVDDYPCTDNGQNCKDMIFAVSIAGVKPSANITWFQAQQACGNSRKRLPSNGEWQLAVAGSPDPGPDDDSTDCNTTNDGFPANDPVNVGSRSTCVSSWGAYDMVGNVWEWVADWMPRSTTCGTWSGSGDDQCLAGAATTGEPGALIRGGGFNLGALAGPLAVDGNDEPSFSASSGCVARASRVFSALWPFASRPSTGRGTSDESGVGRQPSFGLSAHAGDFGGTIRS